MSATLSQLQAADGGISNTRAVLAECAGNQVALLVNVDLAVEGRLDLVRVRPRREDEVVLYVTV